MAYTEDGSASYNTTNLSIGVYWAGVNKMGHSTLLSKSRIKFVGTGSA